VIFFFFFLVRNFPLNSFNAASFPMISSGCVGVANRLKNSPRAVRA